MSRLWRDEHGANVVEYAIILGFVVLVAVVALTLVGADTNTLIDDPVLSASLT